MALSTVMRRIAGAVRASTQRNMRHSTNARRSQVNHNAEWMTPAEQRSDPALMYRVGMAHILGEDGATKDAALGKAMLQEAAELGHPRAQATLGSMAYNEMEALRTQAHVHDYQAAAEAERWLKRAAEQGEIDATRTLIPLYVARGNLPAALSTFAMWMRRLTVG